MAVPNSGDISSTGNVQQHFSVPSTGTQSAVSIIAQDPSKGVYIVDPSQQHTAAALQMFGTEQRLIAASANPVEISNPNTSTPAQTIMVCGCLVSSLLEGLRQSKKSIMSWKVELSHYLLTPPPLPSWTEIICIFLAH